MNLRPVVPVGTIPAAMPGPVTSHRAPVDSNTQTHLRERYITRGGIPAAFFRASGSASLRRRRSKCRGCGKRHEFRTLHAGEEEIVRTSRDSRRECSHVPTLPVRSVGSSIGAKLSRPVYSRQNSKPTRERTGIGGRESRTDGGRLPRRLLSSGISVAARAVHGHSFQSKGMAQRADGQGWRQRRQPGMGGARVASGSHTAGGAYPIIAFREARDGGVRAIGDHDSDDGRARG